jgi:hypothetical protein
MRYESERARGQHPFEDRESVLQISLKERVMKQSLATTNQETVDGGGGLKIFFRYQ